MNEQSEEGLLSRFFGPTTEIFPEGWLLVFDKSVDMVLSSMFAC